MRWFLGSVHIHVLQHENPLHLHAIAHDVQGQVTMTRLDWTEAEIEYI